MEKSAYKLDLKFKKVIILDVGPNWFSLALYISKPMRARPNIFKNMDRNFRKKYKEKRYQTRTENENSKF
jgi:hypothetical protein